MKTLRSIFAGSLLLLMCAAASMAQTIQSDYDRNFNLAKLTTYSFQMQERGPRDPLAASPINDRRIHDALDTQLKANGLAPSTQAAFTISYFVKTQQALDIRDNRMGPLRRWGNIDVNQITEGTLIVVFTDTASGQEVWRGFVTGTLNAKDLDKDVNKGVTKLIQKFKKDQGGKK